MAEHFPGSEGPEQIPKLIHEDPNDPFQNAFWQIDPISDRVCMGLGLDLPPSVQFVDNGHGGQLAYHIRGRHGGTRALNIGGNPSGLISPNPRWPLLYGMDLEYMTYDRPGYGYSDRIAGRSMHDSAEHIERIFEDAGWDDDISICARSGGVPHAAAIASQLGSRITHLALLSGISPSQDVDPATWQKGMTPENMRLHKAAIEDPLELARRYRNIAAQTLRAPTSFYNNLRQEDGFNDGDKHAVEYRSIRSELARGYTWALRQGGVGWFDDTLAIHKNWGIDFSKISAETVVWHGADDPFADVLHAHEISRLIPESSLIISSAASHFNSLEVIIYMLGWFNGGVKEKLRDNLIDMDLDINRYRVGRQVIASLNGNNVEP